MRLRNYFVIGAFCLALFFAWTFTGACGLDKIGSDYLEMVRSQRMIIDTIRWGKVVFILPEGVPDIVKIIGHRSLPSSPNVNVGIFQVITDVGVYQIWVDINRPIPLGIVTFIDEEWKGWIYKTGRANYSGDPSLADQDEFFKFVVSRANQAIGKDV